MTIEQALKIIKQIASETKATVTEHNTIQRAILVIEQKLFPKEEKEDKKP